MLKPVPVHLKKMSLLEMRLHHGYANFNYDAGWEGQVLGIYNGTGTSNPTIALNHDGSAAFSGAVDVGPFDAGTTGTWITNSGTIYNLAQALCCSLDWSNLLMTLPLNLILMDLLNSWVL